MFLYPFVNIGIAFRHTPIRFSMNASPSSESETTRILVVDDEPLQLKALVDVLRLEGYEVQGWDSAEAALQGACFTDADLLITDLQMPGVDGIEFIRRVQAQHPDLPGILVTAHASIESAVDAMRSGAVDYVPKPFRLSTMISTVERALALQRLRRRNHQLQDEIRRQYEQLLVVNQELDAFAARLSHDLRGPVANMRGILQLVVDEHGAELPPDMATLVQAGVRSGDTALKMVRDLLDFARLGNRDLTLEPVDLGPLLEQARADVKASFPPQGCCIDIQPLPVVLGHAGLLQQVFVNLLGNGVKYSASRPHPQVTVSAVPPGPDGLVRLQVADNGVGFDPALAARLFRPFQRLHPTGTFTGEGMGLANVKRIVERHGGTVTAEGRPGEGAVFTVALRPA